MQNYKLFSAEGYIGRRGFLINFFYVQIIITLITSLRSLFSLVLVLFFPGILKQGLFTYYPDEFVALLMAILNMCLMWSTVKRRVHDIIGDGSQNKLWIYTLFFNIFPFFVYSYLYEMYKLESLSPAQGLGLVAVLCIASFIFLCCKKGTLSVKDEENNLIKFNWAGFLGTWIWGLLNNVKQALLMLIMFFLGEGMIFSIICGLKGNEWAYKQSKDISVEEFHKKQQKQIYTVLWAVPLIFFILLFLTGSIVNNKNNYNIIKNKANSCLSKVAVNTVYAGFDRVEIADNEYNFYLSPKTWSKMSQKDKEELFAMAVFYIASKKNINLLDEMPVDIPNNVKFYDSGNERFLLGCTIPESLGQKLSAKGKERASIYKQYLHY